LWTNNDPKPLCGQIVKDGSAAIGHGVATLRSSPLLQFTNVDASLGISSRRETGDERGNVARELADRSEVNRPACGAGR
jgi:hypothetical protein